MRNTIILSAVLFFAVIAASIYYFKNLDNNHQSTKSLRLLPENTLLIAAINNQDSSAEVFKDFEILDALVGFDNSKLWNTFRTQFLNNVNLEKHSLGNTIYISFHPEKKQVIPLFTIPITEDIPATTLTNTLNDINKKFKTATIDTLDQRIYQIHYGAKDSILHAIYFDSNILASTSLSVLTAITDKHSKRLPDEQVDFFLKENPSKTSLSVYFPHQQYNSIIDLTQQSNKGPFIDLFKKLHGQSVWNINLSQDALILTGESQIDQYPENYASIFKNQEKAPQNLYSYFPSNTAIYAEFAVSNTQVFQKELENLFKRRNEPAAAKDTSNTTSLLNNALGNHFALVETTAQNYIGFINISDSVAFKELSNKVLETTSDSIGRFLKSGLLYKHYGDVFNSFPRPYYTVIDSIFIVANSPATLRDYRKNYVNNDLLIGTLGFIQLEKAQSREANVTIFAHARNANSKLTNSLNQTFREPFRNAKKFGYQNFFSWSIQLSGNKGNITSQLYAIYKSKNTLGVDPEWSIKMENKAITKPFVFQQSDTSQFILIQELDHTIHAISPTGGKIWSKVFAGRVVGDLQQLEDQSITFLTDKNIFYRIGTDGIPFRGFPKTLKAKPTGTALVTKNANQEILVVPTDHELYAFDLNGNALQTWESVQFKGKITSNIVKSDQGFIFGTSTGHIYWLDERGKKTGEVKTKNNMILTLEPIASNELLALDNNGGVYHLVDRAEKDQWNIASDSTNYYPSIPYLINSNKKIIVTINNNKLEVFEVQDTLKVGFEYLFTKPIADQVQFFNNPDNKNIPLIGLASKSTNLLYLFNETGQIINGFPVEGRPLFYYGKINNSSDSYLLCMRRDNKLYAFKQQN